MTVGLLISGNLGSIILNQLRESKEITLLFVYTDFKSVSIIECCNENNIPLFVGNPRDGKSVGFLGKLNAPELLLSVNYLFIVEKDIIAKALRYAINIHGSLLPKYRGRTPHIWAIINNEKVTGITAHLMEEGCDEGDIILQIEVPILDSYTGQDVLNKFNDLYPKIVDELVSKLESNKITLFKQNHELATFFEKRTPEDGKISFDWQKERIYNWIRAQAKPYPGAFCFNRGEKIIIHQVEYSDLGFTQNMQNGLVIKVEYNLVYFKTPNGVLKVTKFEKDYIIKQGDVLL